MSKVKPFAVARCLFCCMLLTGYAVRASDVEVTHIERDPKYEKYLVQYTSQTYTDDFTPYEISSAVGLYNPGAKRWPDGGEVVTFTAHVLNRGDDVVGAFDYTWTLDGGVVDSGSFAASLAPGATTTSSVTWSWDAGRHTVGFRVDLPGDATPDNNALTDFTDALSLFTLVEQSYDDDFEADTASVPAPRTAFMTEWLQNHIERINELLRRSGAPTRVRFDELSVVPDGSFPNGCDADCKYYDGTFPEVFRAGDQDLRLGGSVYYDAGEDIDYGLLHEWGHQLGLIDQYRLKVSAEQNKVNDETYIAPAGLMMDVSHFVNEHTAGALASWHGHRRGYFGQYLYDLPKNNILLVEDLCAAPLAGALVNVYQKVQRASGEEEIPDLVKFTGSSDPQGHYTLPDVPVDTTNFPPTATGNELRPNPFGYISNHGDNGLFLLEFLLGSEASYRFLDILEFNLRYWKGDRQSATYPVRTGLLSGTDPTNIALSAPASADIADYVSGWCGMTTPSVPGNANDGDMQTVWCRDHVDPGNWWEVDLGEEKFPYKIVVHTDYRAFRLEGSRSGVFAGEQTLLYRRDGPLVGSQQAQTLTFYPKPARFVRLTIEQAQDWVQHRELEVYGASAACWSGPMDVPPDSVRLRKSGPALTIDWGETCGLADDFTIYEGSLDTLAASGVYDHATLVCSDQGSRLTETFTPSPGNRYYLVVPRQSDGTEGGYGYGRPQGSDAAPCGITAHDPGECP
jgi:hypothetical protein